MNSRTLATLAIIGMSPVTEAFWRMECRGSTGLARIDPIVDFSKISPHAHTVHGSSGEFFYLASHCTLLSRVGSIEEIIIYMSFVRLWSKFNL